MKDGAESIRQGDAMQDCLECRLSPTGLCGDHQPPVKAGQFVGVLFGLALGFCGLVGLFVGIVYFIAWVK